MDGSEAKTNGNLVNFPTGKSVGKTKAGETRFPEEAHSLVLYRLC
jgi:hypothetical protein